MSAKMRLQLLTAFVGENLAGGYYHRLSELYRDDPELSSRLRKTAGDEVRHGEYFSQCHEQQFGRKLPLRKLLVEGGRVAANLGALLPERVLSRQLRLKALAWGEAAAVSALEDELRRTPANPYLDIVAKILPDERTHAAPYKKY